MQLKYPITTDYLTSIALWVRAFKRQFNKTDLVTIGQFLVLDLLESSGGSLQPKEIARHFSLKPSTITTTVSNLESAGLVTREDDNKDRRIVHVRCTSKALLVVREGRLAALEVVQKYKAPLGRYLKKELDRVPDLIIQSNDLAKRPLSPIGVDYYKVTLFCELKLSELLKTEKLTSLGFRILFELSEHPKGLHSNDLAWKLLAVLPDITLASNELEKRNLIQRHRDTVDRRAVLLDITNEGYSFLNRIAPLVDTLFLNVAPQLSSSEREVFLKAAIIVVNDQRKRFRPE